MPIELLTPLPPGADSFTRLARQGARCVVLREIKEGTDCSYPLGSPGLVTLEEVLELEGKRQALFPYVPGVTLRELLAALDASGETVPVGFVGLVLVSAARSLQNMQPSRAHGGIADAALQLGFDGSVSLLDFGAPRVSRFRAVGRVNFSADVFALGAVMHAAFTGFEGAYATRLATLPAPSTSHPGVTAAVDDVVMKALSAEPDARQASAGAFADALVAALGDELFSREQLAALVQQHFGDRQRLLEALTVDDVEQALGDGSIERTEPRIVAPPPSEKELLPWDSKPSLPPVMVVDAPPLEAGDGRTQPRVNLPPELIEEKAAGPVPEPSAPRATGQRASTTKRGTGEHGISGPTPRMTGQRAALVPRRSTGEFVRPAPDVPAGAAFDGVASSESGPIPIAPSPRNTGERAAVVEAAAKASGPVPGARPEAPRRSTGERSSLSPPRATGQREALSEADAGAETGVNPRPGVLRKMGQRDAVADGDVSAPGAREALVEADASAEPRPSAPVRKTGQRDAVVELDANAQTGVTARPSAPPRKTGARDALSDATTDPRPSDSITDPRPPPSASVGKSSDVDPHAETGINPKPSVLVRKTGQRDAVRKTGARDALADVDLEGDTSPRASAPVRKTGARDALSDADLEGDTSPRASAPVRKTGARDALPDLNAPVRKTGAREALGDVDGETNPRASAPVRPREALGNTHDETNPRASAPPAVLRMTGQRAALDAPPLDEADPTNPRAKNPILSRTANTADRLWAATQERVDTPPHGTPVVRDSQEEIDVPRDEPTAVRERPRRAEPEQTAQTNQSLPTASSAPNQPKADALPLGMGVLILLLLITVVGIGVGVLRKVQQANVLEPLPEELALELDAGLVAEQTVDAGEEALEVLPVLPTLTEDAGVDEEEDDADAGEEEEDELDAGVTEPTLDAGVAQPAPAKKAVKKKRRRRR